MTEEIRRGDVYWAELSDNRLGCEQMGLRPVVIIQNDIGNHFSPTLIVVPMTTARKRPMPTHLRFSAGDAGLPRGGIALCESIMTIDRSRLRNRAGHLGSRAMTELDSRLRISLSL